MAGEFGSPPRRARSRESFMGSGRGCDALPEGLEESGGTSREPGGLGKVWRGQEVCPEGQEGSGGPTERDGRSWEVLSEGQ